MNAVFVGLKILSILLILSKGGQLLYKLWTSIVSRNVIFTNFATRIF